MSKVYVGGIDTKATEADIEEEFVRFGALRSVWVARKPPGFAFVEFENGRDAEDAIRKLDGFQGWRVELSRKGGPGGGGGGGGRDRYNEYDRGPPRGGMRSDLRCYNCGDPGHFSRECTRPPRDDRGRDRGFGGGGAGGGGGGSRYRSRSPVRRRSPSYSPQPRRSPSYGKSASRSPKRSPRD